MKISNSIQKITAPQPSAAAGSARKAASASASAVDDEVQLSGVGTQVSQGISSSPANKLAQLSDAVSSGRYLPDANAVSGSIIQHAMAAGA